MTVFVVGFGERFPSLYLYSISASPNIRSVQMFAKSNNKDPSEVDG